jgi:2-hydroxy-3-oxopropionate reductase
MLAGDFTPGGTVKNQIKDLDAALTVAKSIGIELPMLQTTRAQFQTLADSLGDQLDHSALYRLWETVT